MTPLEIFAVAWLTGTTVTYVKRIRPISTSSPVAGFAIAFFAWPVFWIGR